MQAARRTVKGRRQNLITVTLEGEGKLGLTFVKESQPPEVKAITDGGLAAQVRAGDTGVNADPVQPFGLIPWTCAGVAEDH